MDSINKNVVLVVDDSPSIRRYVRAILEKEGYIVREAESEVGMFNSIEEHGQRVDIILMDLVLGNENSFELVQKLKNSRSYEDIPVIFLTQNSEKDNVILAKMMGAHGYIIKPVEPVFLIDRIKKALG